MKQVNVSEVTEMQLNWLVGTIETIEELVVYRGIVYALDGQWSYRPATNWNFGGPIIEREHIGLLSPSNKLTMFWTADIGFESKFTQFDHDPLVAAMRCLVCSKLGTTVEVPDELI